MVTLKLTLQMSERAYQNLIIECSDGSTIAELEGMLAEYQPELGAGSQQFGVQYADDWVPLDREARVTNSGLVSGDVVGWISGEHHGAIRVFPRRSLLVQRSIPRPMPQPSAPALPDLPTARPAARAPQTAIFSSLAVGGVSFLLTGSPLSLVFVLVGPLLLLAPMLWARLARWERWLEPRQYRKRQRELSTFREGCEAACAAERAAQEVRYPSLTTLRRALHAVPPRIWQQDAAEAVELRLGQCAQPSRVAAELRETFQKVCSESGWKLNPRKLPAAIRELEQVLDGVSMLDAMPFVWRINRGEQVGFTGADLMPMLSAALAALVLSFSPHQLRISVVQGRARHSLDQLCWVPHFMPVEQASDSTSTQQFRMLIALYVDAEQRAKILDLTRQLPELTVLWVTDEAAELPAGVSQYVSTVSGVVHTSVTDCRQTQLSQLEQLTATEAEELYRQLAPLVDADATVSATELPRQLLLSELLATGAEQIAGQWSTPQPHTGLAVPIGRGLSGMVRLDLVTDGPHALIAGTTGSGKSEFLQSWVLAMAHHYSPEEFTVCFIDFKGGATFRPLLGLPHQVGLVTDLDEAQMARVMTSLFAELRHRERLFATIGAQSLLEYRVAGGRLARLVIVVDEFAAVMQEHPELADLFSALAARGRSLGMHLVMATQRPAGVVPAALAANLGLRVAFRTADAVESRLVIDSDEAARIPVQYPGRAVLRRSHSGTELVQIATVAAANRSGVRVLREFTGSTAELSQHGSTQRLARLPTLPQWRGLRDAA